MSPFDNSSLEKGRFSGKFRTIIKGHDSPKGKEFFFFLKLVSPRILLRQIESPALVGLGLIDFPLCFPRDKVSLLETGGLHGENLFQVPWQLLETEGEPRNRFSGFPVFRISVKPKMSRAESRWPLGLCGDLQKGLRGIDCCTRRKINIRFMIRRELLIAFF